MSGRSPEDGRARPVGAAPALGALACVIAMMTCVLTASEEARAARLLVAVGDDEGLATDAPLRWAEADAARFIDLFVDIGGVSAARAVLLRGADPRALERALLEVRGQVAEIKRRGERAELVLTYSGHGDGDSLHMAGQALAVAALLRWVDDVGADATVVVLDACRTSPLRSGSTRGARRAPAFDINLVREPAPTGRVVIAAAADGEVAQESDDLEGAFFTHHLLAGMRGAADDDSDGVVTLAELYGYAHARTLTGSFGRGEAVQHPEMKIDLRGQGELVLTRLDRAAASLTLDAALDGAFLVADARAGSVLFEVEKSAGRALTLAVPPRRLRVQQRSRVGGALSVADVDVARGAAVTLAGGAFVEAPRVAGRTRGGLADVDTTPWGAAVALAAGSAPTLPALSSALFARAERRLFETPLFLELSAHASRATGGDAQRAIDETDVAAHAGVLAELWTGVGRATLSAGVGARGVSQRIDRKDAARLADAGFGLAPTVEAGTLGPSAEVRAGFSVPVLGRVSVEAGALAGAAALVVDGAVRPAFSGALVCGLAVEL